jgi:alpha-N-acetylglucosaminidase
MVVFIQIDTKENYVEISGTTGVAAAMGLYYYLTNYCNCQITWGGQQLAIPSPLPKVDGGNVNITTNDR